MEKMIHLGEFLPMKKLQHPVLTIALRGLTPAEIFACCSTKAHMQVAFLGFSSHLISFVCYPIITKFGKTGFHQNNTCAVFARPVGAAQNQCPH